MPKTPKKTSAPPKQVSRDHAVAARARVETAAQLAALAISEMRETKIVFNPVLAPLVRAHVELEKALAHARELIARIP